MLDRAMSPLPCLGIVVGLRAEARIARPLGRVEIGGGLPDGARAAAARLIGAGARGLLSFGLAGGLDPELAAGAMVVPGRVLHRGLGYDADPGLLAWLGGATAGALIAAEAPVGRVAAKGDLFRRSRAVAVDLESGELAALAAAHGVPFAVLRVICDPAGRALPPAALVALDQKGAIGGLRIAASVMRRPWQIPALLRLAGDAAAAHATLRRMVAGLR
jgi:adenosylhomocysteine nucleosidase